jgi:ABC-type transport system involved in multi-copper enzyme maturation permease subunit
VIAGIATVARQEFRLRIRAGRWKLLLGAWALVLLLFTLLLASAVDQLSEQELPYRGTIVYGGLAILVLGLSLLVVPALAAQSVNGDRERGTLAVLQVTRLRPVEIVLGKFVAAWGTALVFLGLSLPFVAYAMTLGGVPLRRVVVVTLVVALLLGTVCALSLWLSAVLSRTTTSGVLAYLAVFALSIGTLIVFGLATALTSETYTETFRNECPPDTPGCVAGEQSYESSRVRTDRTWFLLAPNPFVVLADAAPQLPEPDEEEEFEARSLDPLGQIGSAVRFLREGPDAESRDGDRGAPVWPAGLLIDVLLGAGALALTVRRLRTPTRELPRGQRVA